MKGMLWFDNDPKTTVEQKIVKALEYHKKRFEREADVVAINTISAEGIDLEALSKACNVTVTAVKYVTPHHFVVGFEDQAVELLNQ